MSRLIATVGINIDDKRFEEGQEVPGDALTDHQKSSLLNSGALLVIEKGQKVPADAKAAVETGAATPNPVIGRMEV